MWGIKVKHVLGLRAIAAVSGLALALIVGTTASSAISSGAARQAADSPRPGSGFSVSLERRGMSHGKVAPGAAVRYRIEIRLPAGSTDSITVATVTDPVGVTLSAVCRKRRVKTPAPSLPSTFASGLPSTPGTIHRPAESGMPAPITQEISNAYPTQPSGTARTRPWRPTCVMTASGSAHIRAVVHVPKSMAPGTTMQIAVLGIALPAGGAKGGSGSARPALAIAFASLTTRPAHEDGDGDGDADDGNGATPSPGATPTVTVSAAPTVSATPTSNPAPAVLAEEYLASMTAALGHAPSATMATALRSLASAFQQLAAAIPAPTATPAATPTPLPSGTRFPRSPSAAAISSLLPLIPTSPTGLALPMLSPSSSSTSRPSVASGYAQPANSSTANLNWPDVAALAVIVGAILALLVWRRSRNPQFWHDNRG